MAIRTLLSAAGVALWLLACVAKEQGEDAPAGGVTRSPGAAGRSQSAGVVIDSAGGQPAAVPSLSGLMAATGGSPSTSPSAGVAAEQTPDGLYPISATQASEILADPAQSCAGWADRAEQAPSVVEFIIDVSGSMDERTGATRNQTKWEVTRKALVAAISQLPSNLAVGMSFYPAMESQYSSKSHAVNACIDTSHNVGIAPLTPEQIARLAFQVDSMKDHIEGATPTHDAYELALTALRSDTHPGQKHLILITDGQPTLSKGCVGTGSNCPPEPTQPIIDAVAAAMARDQVKTFIVGSPGSEENGCSNEDLRAWLSAAARAGGTAPAGCSDLGPNYCHFDLTQAKDFGAALAAALGSIAQTVVSCDYTVPAPTAGQTIDKDRVNMIYDDGAGSSALVLPSATADCQRGWQFTDATAQKIRICPETCALLQANPKAAISLVFGCTQEQLRATIL